MSRVVILVPRRADNGRRDDLWTYCRARWEQHFPEFPIYEGHHLEGPFNRSAALNLAADLADADGRWDAAIIIDSDVFLRVSQVHAAVKEAMTEGKVMWAHRRWRSITDHWTRRILADRQDFGPEIDGEDMDLIVNQTNPISWSCCIVVPRVIWDDLGGFDERFAGWGFEDMAFQAVVRGLYPYGRIDADIYHLWHERSGERLVKGKTAQTATPEYIRNALLGRRYMVAVIRDYHRGDQPGEHEMPPEKVKVHVSNLTLDDEKFLAAATRLRMPEAREWRDWWPTLDELRAGAIAHRQGQPPTVTVVVHTGGDKAHWADRRDYLRRSLESLSRQVTGPIVQRVVYDVWGSADIREEIEAFAIPLGFYVVGPTPEAWQPGHPWSRNQLWRYLRRHAVGEFIFGTEDDFVYDRPVDLEQIARTMRRAPHLRQVALLRAPYFARELEAGGIIEQKPGSYQWVDGLYSGWVEHRDHFTNNPSLYRRSLVEAYELPAVANSEVRFAELLNRDPASRFAYWGHGEPWVSHIGEVRAGTTY